MKKICLVAPSLQMGGIERAMSTLANQFVKRGYEVYFVTIFPFEHFFELDNRIKLYEPKYPFPKKGRSLFFTIYYYFKMLFPFGGEIAKTVRIINPNVVMSFGDWIPHLVMLGLKNKYSYYYCNRSNPNIQYPKFLEDIRRLAYKLTPPTGIIAQTNKAKERKVKLVKKDTPIRVIPNPARDIKKYDVEKQNWIISVGRLHFEKGFIRLIEVFSKLEAPDWKLIIVGGGVHEQQIKDKAMRLGIEDRVIFTGKSNEVDKLLRMSKIYAFSSHNEGFPNALCEGLSAGLPAVSFDIVAGPNDIIEDGENGFLVKDNDLETYKEKLQMLIDKPELREKLGKKASLVTQRYDINKITQKYLDFILKH